MDRLGDYFSNKFNGVGFGYPPKYWKSILIFAATVYFELVEKFVYYLPRTSLYLNEQTTWEDINWLVTVDYSGSLLCLLISPIIDNYRIHLEALFACHGAISILSVFYTYTVLLPPGERVSQFSLFALSSLTQFTKPIFISYATLQHPERVGPPSKFVFTAFFTMSMMLQGFLQVAMSWANYGLKGSSIHVTSILLITTYPVLIGMFMTVTIIKRNEFCKAESRPGDTLLTLKCFGRAIHKCTSGSCFETMLNYFDYTTVIHCKKATKIFVILLATSFNSTLLRVMDLPWMFQYFALKRVGIFKIIEFNALNTFITAIFIPMTEYVLIPLIRKIKLASYIPIYSIMICLAYLFTCLACILTLWLQNKTELTQPTRLDYHNARIYLINTLDTYSYVRGQGFPITRIPAASIKSYMIKDNHPKNGLLQVNFRIYNLYYGVNNDLARAVQHQSTVAYILTKNDAYELSAVGLKQSFFKVISDPTYVTWPTIAFICPINMSDGDFFPWCDAKVKIWIFNEKHKHVVTEELDLLEVGNGTVIDIPPDTIVSIQMTFQPLFNHDKNIIEFSPAHGGKYVLMVWAGDVHLRVKYRLITLHTLSKYTTNYAIPQIVCRALGFALGLVSMCTLVKINTPHSLYTVGWAFLFLSTKIFTPFLFVMNFFSLRQTSYQLPFVAVNVLMFFAVVLAVRIART